QYYFNSGREFAKRTPEAFASLGANNLAELMRRANAIYETENSDITQHLDKTLEGFSKSYVNNPLNELDGEFYDLSKVEDLTQLKASFIRKNKNEFVD